MLQVLLEITKKEEEGNEYLRQKEKNTAHNVTAIFKEICNSTVSIKPFLRQYARLYLKEK